MHCMPRREDARARPGKRARTVECGLHPVSWGSRRPGCAEAPYDLQIAARDSVRYRVTELRECKAKRRGGAGPSAA